jgi:hypothetical protein
MRVERESAKVPQHKTISGKGLLTLRLTPNLEDHRGSRVRFPKRAGNFSLHYRVQNGSGTHPDSYPMGTRGSFLE